MISFILNPQFEGILYFIKTGFVALSSFMAVLIVFLLLKNSWLKRKIYENAVEFTSYKPFGVKKDFKQWRMISQRMDSDKEADYKLAIIEADDLLDEALGRMGYKGDDLEEKLSHLDKIILPNLEEILEIRKIRNNAVYDPDYKLSLDQAKKTLAAYEEALRNLDIF